MFLVVKYKILIFVSDELRHELSNFPCMFLTHNEYFFAKHCVRMFRMKCHIIF